MKQEINHRANVWRHLFTLLCLMCTTIAWAGTWTVAGTQAVFGTNWDPSNTANVMTLVQGTSYQWSKQFTLPQQTSIEFKVVKGNSWGEEYPSDNYKIEDVPKGIYILTITFDEATHEVGAILAEMWSIAGEPAEVFGLTWNTSSNDMTLVDGSSNTYQWTSSQFTFSQATDIVFKVVKDHAWGTEYPSSNYTIDDVPKGTYTLTVTFNSETHEISHHLNRIITDFYLMDNHGGSWNIDEGRAFSLNETTATLSGVELTYGDYFFFSSEKASSSDNWSDIEPYRYGPSSGTTTINSGKTYTAASGNGNSYQPAKSGIWSFDYNLGNNEWTGTLTAAAADAKWYLLTNSGSGFRWDSPIEMTRNGNTFTHTKALTAGNYIIFPQAVGNDWGSTIRYTCNGNEDEAIESGVTYSATRHGNKAYVIPTTGQWTFTYNYLTDQWSATREDVNINTGEMYVIGMVNGNPWHADMGIKMTANGNEFTLKNVQIIANADFSFATRLGMNEHDWGTVNAYRLTSAAEGDFWLVTDDMTNKDNPTTLTLQARNNEDKNFMMQSTGRYNITVNWSDPTHPSVTITRVGEVYQSLYMLGGPKGWAGNEGTEFFTTDGTTYTANMTLEPNTYFQFATQLGTSHDSYPADVYRFGAESANLEIGEEELNSPLTIVARNNNDRSFKMTVQGIFKVVVTATTNNNQLIPTTVTLQRIASVGNETIIHLEKNGQVTNPVLHAYNKERYNSAYGGSSIHVDRPSKEDLINTRQPLNVIDLDETTTPDGRRWWSWKVENAIADFFFTRDESETDSEILWRRAGELYFTWPNNGTTMEDYTRDYYAAAAQEIADCATMLEGHYYVYFTNTPGWKQVFCHAWYNDNGTNYDLLTPPTKPATVENEGPMYPGDVCTLVGYDKDGYEVWRYDFGLLSEMEHLPTGIIFNNGIQTVKLQDGQGNEVRITYDFMTGLETTDGKYQTSDFVAKNGGNYDYCGMISLGRSLGNIIRNGIVDGPPYTIEEDLEAVWLDENATTVLEGGTVYGALYCKDLNNFVSTSFVEKSLQQEGEIDYVISMTNLMGQKTRYDQSNWVKLTLSRVNTAFAAMDKDAQLNYLRNLVGNILKAETVTGQLVDNMNPEIRITESPVTDGISYYSENPNVFITANFLGSQDSGIEGSTNRYFLVTPKPQEYATITWAVYGGNNEFFIPTRHAIQNDNGKTVYMNEADLNGYFSVSWDLMDKPDWMENGVNGSGEYTGQAYKFEGIIRLAEETPSTPASAPRRENEFTNPSQPYKHNVTSSRYIVSPINISNTSSGIVTSVSETKVAKTVKRVRYYNVAGIESTMPFDGMNIIVTEYNDGTKSTRKEIKNLW